MTIVDCIRLAMDNIGCSKNDVHISVTQTENSIDLKIKGTRKEDMWNELHKTLSDLSPICTGTKCGNNKEKLIIHLDSDLCREDSISGLVKRFQQDRECLEKKSTKEIIELYISFSEHAENVGINSLGLLTKERH